VSGVGDGTHRGPLIGFDPGVGRAEHVFCASHQGEEETVTHPNEDLARRGFEAFAIGDMATLNELFADDIVWHSPGNNQLSGTYRGKGQVFAQFQKVAEMTGGTFKVDIHALLGDDEHVVALTRASGEREGMTLNDNTVQVLHVKDGKVTESWLHPGDAQAADELWS
jgi:ketosteroid isomerase-like protein